MQKIYVSFLFLIFLFGCTNQIKQENTIKVNTANISFIRTTDVLNTQTEFQSMPAFEFERNKTDSLIVSYFYSPNCSGHIAAAPIIQKLKSNYTQYEWRGYDITTQNGTLAYLQFAERYNLSKDLRLVPQVLINGTVFSNSEEIQRDLETRLKNPN